MMSVGIAADHGGFGLKEQLADDLRPANYEVLDFGAYELVSGDDYPDVVVPLARAVAKGEVARGIAICGSGVGACVAANKVPGVRACLIHDGFVSLEVSPHLARDTASTIEQARHLWAALDRPNVMIKVPATVQGLPAIQQLIAWHWKPRRIER